MLKTPLDNFLPFLKNGQNGLGTISSYFWKIGQNDLETFSSHFWKLVRMAKGQFPQVSE